MALNIKYLLHAPQLFEPLGLEGLTDLLDTNWRRNAERNINGFLHIED